MQDELERLLLALLCVISQFAAQPELDLATHPGHLKPLGSQGPVHPIDELTAFPDSSTFYKRYTKASKPLLVKGGAKDSPAYALWTDEYLTGKEEAKSEIVTVEYGKKENRTKGSKLYSMKEFVEAYKKENIYLVAGVPKYIMQDVLLPYSLRCGGYQSQLVDTVMWFSSGGTKSVLHHDNVDNINCLFAGRKEMYFIEYPKYKAQVNLDHSEGGYSSVDPDSVDLIKYPGLKDVEFYFVQMEPGDCLYIPYKWYHHVRSYDRNIAVNVWWAPLLQFNASDCHQSINDEGLPTIDKYQFEVLNKNKSDEDDDDELSENMSDYFRGLLKDDKAMTLGELILKMQKDKNIMTRGVRWVKELDPIVAKMFNILDYDGDNMMTLLDINHLTDEDESMLLAITDELEEVLDNQKIGYHPNDSEDNSVQLDEDLPNETERDEL